MKTPPVPFPTLLAELTDPNSQARLQAIKTIMRRPNERGQAFASLLALLSDPDVQVCKAAIKALSTMGDPRAIPALRPFLTHQNAHLRLLTLQTLVLLDRQQALPYLFTALHDQRVSIRTEAVSFLYTLGDTGWQVRSYVAHILGQLRDARAVAPLIAALGDAHWAIREGAATLLGTLGDPHAVEPLIAALNDKEKRVRQAVATALGRLRDARAREPLRTLLVNPWPGMVRQTREVIAWLEGSV